MSTPGEIVTPARIVTHTEWAELVTTALLGTDRRTLDVADPPVAVLHDAARHRVLDRLTGTGRSPATEVQPAVAPSQDRPDAPATADRLLAELLRVPDPTVVSCWLRSCARHGYAVAAVHWTRLARLAARTTAYDRPALGACLGQRGRWFLRQNPDWRKLAEDAERSEVAPPAAGQGATLVAEDVLTDPERLLGAPQPWPPELVSAAYAVLGGEGAGPPPRTFATRLGVALPPALYPSIAQAGQYYLLAPDASPARRRTVRDRFVALELAAYARAAVDDAFRDLPIGFTRAEIPHV